MIRIRHEEQANPQGQPTDTSPRQTLEAAGAALVAPECAYRDSEQRWRGLLNRISQGFCIIEMLYDAAGEPVDYRFLEVNPTFEEHTGLRDAVGKTARQLVPGLEMEWVRVYARVAAGDEPLRFEQGSAAMGRWFDIEAVPVDDPGRREVALLFTDITARKRSEQATRLAHERLAFALERLDGFLYDYDLRTGQTERSEDFARVLGYAPHEVPPHSDWWGRQIHPDDYARAVSEGRAAQDGDAEGYSLEYRVRHRDGHYLTVWDRGEIERDAEGRARRVLGTTINITERKQGEAERAALLAQVQEALQATSAALARAEEATRERDLLISIAAHDLRTPLTAILGQAQLLHRRAERSGLDERDQRTLATIVAQSERLNQMIGALLDLSRIQEGRLMIEPRPLDLVHTLERVVAEARATVTAHAIMLRAPRTPLTISADPIRLEQVLHNLLGNAVKYSPDGGTVEVAVEEDADAVRILVRDEGIGIPTTALPHLFTRFYRAPNATAHATSSMGVGLYVVRELVQAHGGTIAVESTEGQGSTFIVRLPLP